jgi:hypothetical protein
VLLVAVWWNVKYFRSAVAYVTERRVIRFTPSFAVTYSKRMVFWRDVLKTKSVSDNVFWRLLKVGILEVVPKSGADQSLLLRSVYYYEDLGNYFDKLVYLTNAEPHELKTVRPFVALPRWERYPQELEIRAEEEQVLIDHRDRPGKNNYDKNSHDGLSISPSLIRILAGEDGTNRKKKGPRML